jgi:uncharacterized Zn-finger protein
MATKIINVYVYANLQSEEKKEVKCLYCGNVGHQFRVDW